MQDNILIITIILYFSSISYGGNIGSSSPGRENTYYSERKKGVGGGGTILGKETAV